MDKCWNQKSLYPRNSRLETWAKKAGVLCSYSTKWRAGRRGGQVWGVGSRASNGPHTRAKDEMIFALYGKGKVIVEGAETYAMEPYAFIHIPAVLPTLIETLTTASISRSALRSMAYTPKSS